MTNKVIKNEWVINDYILEFFLEIAKDVDKNINLELLNLIK